MSTEPRPCRDEGCDVRVILARRMPSNRWAAYEADDQPPFTERSAGCHVLVSGQAWAPLDLIEDFRVRHELTETAARDLVAGYPFHRPHFHPRDTEGATS